MPAGGSAHVVVVRCLSAERHGVLGDETARYGFEGEDAVLVGPTVIIGQLQRAHEHVHKREVDGVVAVPIVLVACVVPVVVSREGYHVFEPRGVTEEAATELRELLDRLVAADAEVASEMTKSNEEAYSALFSYLVELERRRRAIFAVLRDRNLLPEPPY